MTVIRYATVLGTVTAGCYLLWGAVGIAVMAAIYMVWGAIVADGGL